MLNKKLFFCIVFFVFIVLCRQSFAQQKTDSLTSVNIKKQDTSARKNILALDTSAKKYNPKIATFRSAVLPGWGQAYNKKLEETYCLWSTWNNSIYIFR
jgi:hypothetical protein